MLCDKEALFAARSPLTKSLELPRQLSAILEGVLGFGLSFLSCFQDGVSLIRSVHVSNVYHVYHGPTDQIALALTIPPKTAFWFARGLVLQPRKG